MTYVAIIEAVALVVVVLGFLAYCRTLTRPYVRREDKLVDQVMYLSGLRATTPPMADVPMKAPLAWAEERAEELVGDPENWPD